MMTSETHLPVDRLCLREPIPEIKDAGRLLDQAVSAHLAGNHNLAAKLIQRADIPAIREWTESLWGTSSPYRHVRQVEGAPTHLPVEQRINGRMPNSAIKRLLLERDGYHCRFCGIPVIRAEVRQAMNRLYPEVLPWGKRNHEQHAAFQAMWVQYDHVVPHARGGNSNLDNVVITCAPCNYGRGDWIVEEVGLRDPRTREPVQSSWDGLERFLRHRST